MREQRVLLLLLVGELALAAVVLRVPDIGAAGGFISGGYPTATTALAASALLIWIALLVSAILLVVCWLRHISLSVRSAHLVVGLMVVVSVAMLSFGIVRHLNASYSMCCGSISQARQQLVSPP